MALPTLRQLQSFLAAAEAGSISAAARQLHVTQPAASQHLRELERLLGVRLLERAGGKVVPTAAGNALLGPARQARDAALDAIAITAEYRAGHTGRVRLGTGATACIYLLPPILAAARRRMPGLEIIVATGNTEEMLGRLEAGDLDIALVTLPGTLARTLTARKLLRDPLIALMPPGMVPTDGDLTAARLARLPLILYESQGGTRGIIDAWFRRSGVAARPIMELGNVEAIKMLVGSGLGAAILPMLAVPGETSGTTTRPLRPRLSRDLGLVLRREKVVDRGLGLFIKEVEAGLDAKAA